MQTNESNFTAMVLRNASQNSSSREVSSSVQPQIYLVVSVIAAIFACSLVGNVLVIVAVWQNRSLRTNTNILLVNLSLADLLFATLVMPCTIVSYLRSSFIFGAAFCVVYNYSQGVSVGLSAFTLTVLSLERYYAICKPLSSRLWQTTNHCYKMVALTWVLALLVMAPIAATSSLEVPRSQNWKKCRENWRTSGLEDLELAYTVFLDVILFGIPLLIMTVAYINVGLKMSESVSTAQENSVCRDETQSVAGNCEKSESRKHRESLFHLHTNSAHSAHRESNLSVGCIHNANLKLRLHNKRKVVRMIAVVVLQFFICWAPVYALQTWMSIDAVSAQRHISSTMNLALRLLAFASTCLHPLTYCFMNASFRRGFLQIFRCSHLLSSVGMKRRPSFENQRRVTIDSTYHRRSSAARASSLHHANPKQSLRDEASLLSTQS